MRYPRETYVKYNIFCKTVVDETEKSIKYTEAMRKVAVVLRVIAKILGVGIPVFLALYILISGGVLTYYGGIGALMSANPILGGILLGLGGATLATSLTVLYKERKVYYAVNDIVVKPYKNRFDNAVSKLDSIHGEIPTEHIKAIERLLTEAIKDLLNHIVKIKGISPIPLLRASIGFDLFD